MPPQERWAERELQLTNCAGQLALRGSVTQRVTLAKRVQQSREFIHDVSLRGVLHRAAGEIGEGFDVAEAAVLGGAPVPRLSGCCSL